MSIAEKFEVIADAVYEKGKEAEYDSFWDKYQNQGNKTNYTYAFYSTRWDDTIYNPKYDIIASNANNIFSQTGIKNTLVPIDITNVTGGNSAGMFQYTSKLETIKKLIVNEDSVYLNCFVSCTNLKNITFEGTIGRSISFADSPLTVKSMKNVIEHLKDYSGDETNRGKYTLTFSDACWGNLEASGAAPDGDTWGNYIIKLGWAVSGYVED